MKTYAKFNKEKDWMAVDFDGTLHDRSTDRSTFDPGGPVQAMLDQIKEWRAAGMQVRIFTARVSPIQKGVDDSEIDAFIARQRATIEDWCMRYLGEVLPVTCSKDAYTYQIWDDRAVSVERNTGKILGENPEW